MVSALTFTMQVYMLTNGFAVMPEGFESILYAGFGYTLNKVDAEALIKNGEALSMEDSSGKPKTKNSTGRISGIRIRGKRLPKS